MPETLCLSISFTWFVIPIFVFSKNCSSLLTFFMHNESLLTKNGVIEVKRFVTHLADALTVNNVALVGVE